jgi:hypothetical protein
MIILVKLILFLVLPGKLEAVNRPIIAEVNPESPGFFGAGIQAARESKA